MPFPVVQAVLEQHVEELTTLWAVRDGLCEAADVRLRDLARFDERIAAHEDGCGLGRDDALRLLTSQLAEATAGRIFAATVVGLALNNREMIARCVALAGASKDACRGLMSALGWVEPVQLKGIVSRFLASDSSIQRKLGLAACRLHGADPGPALSAALTDLDAHVRAEALRTAGILGQVELVSQHIASSDEDAACRFWSAWAAVLAGNRAKALDALVTVAFSNNEHRRRAFRLVCQAMRPTAAHEALRQMASDPVEIRGVIEGSGIVGDPIYAPWLISHMTDPKTARLAGEAFSLITGVNFAANGLEGARPDGFESGPNDDPDDPNVDRDPDDGLPWPSVAKTEAWWTANRNRFHKGTRYFMGAPVVAEHCVEVLKSGDQRQRILAAHYRSLLEPGIQLFNTSSPAWRQQRRLAKLA